MNRGISRFVQVLWIFIFFVKYSALFALNHIPQYLTYVPVHCVVFNTGNMVFIVLYWSTIEWFQTQPWSFAEVWSKNHLRLILIFIVLLIDSRSFTTVHQIYCLKMDRTSLRWAEWSQCLLVSFVHEQQETCCYAFLTFTLWKKTWYHAIFVFGARCNYCIISHQ